MKNYEIRDIIILPYGKVMMITDKLENGLLVAKYISPNVLEIEGNIKSSDIGTILSAKFNKDVGVDLMVKGMFDKYVKILSKDFEIGEEYYIKGTEFTVEFYNKLDNLITLRASEGASTTWTLTADSLVTLILQDDLCYGEDKIPEEVITTSIGPAFVPAFSEIKTTISTEEDEKKQAEKEFGDIIDNLIEQLGDSKRDRYNDESFDSEIINSNNTSFEKEILIMKKFIASYDESLKINYSSEGDELMNKVTTFVKSLTLSDKETWSRELRMKIDNLIENEINGYEPETPEENVDQVDFSQIEEVINKNVRDFISINSKDLSDIITGKYVKNASR